MTNSNRNLELLSGALVGQAWSHCPSMYIPQHQPPDREGRLWTSALLANLLQEPTPATRTQMQALEGLIHPQWQLSPASWTMSGAVGGPLAPNRAVTTTQLPVTVTSRLQNQAYTPGMWAIKVPRGASRLPAPLAFPSLPRLPSSRPGN